MRIFYQLWYELPFRETKISRIAWKKINENFAGNWNGRHFSECPQFPRLFFVLKVKFLPFFYFSPMFNEYIANLTKNKTLGKITRHSARRFAIYSRSVWFKWPLTKVTSPSQSCFPWSISLYFWSINFLTLPQTVEFHIYHIYLILNLHMLLLHFSQEKKPDRKTDSSFSIKMCFTMILKF